MQKNYENIIINKDCITGMKAVPDHAVDLIITDPPFAINFKTKRGNYNRDVRCVLEGYNEITPEMYYTFTCDWIEQAYRVLKESGSMFVFSGWTNLRDVLNALYNVGFHTVNHIVWKYQFGPVTKKKFVTSHYHCIYVCKNNSERSFYHNSRFQDGKSRYKDMEDVWIINREYWRKQVKTPTKLPSEIVKKILQYTSQEGDLVLDPFLGSGQVALVSKKMRRRYLGFEIVKAYIDFAQKRIDEIEIMPSEKHL